MPMMPDHTASITAAEPVALGSVLHRIECFCTLKIVCCSRWLCLNSTRTFSRADLALQDTGALAAAEHGRLGVWNTPLYFKGWAPPLPQLDSASVLIFYLNCCLVFALIAAFVCHAYPALFVPHPRFAFKPKSLFFALMYRFSCFVYIRSYGSLHVRLICIYTYE